MSTLSKLKKIHNGTILVGGAVRDAILGRDVKDRDFAVAVHKRRLSNYVLKVKEAFPLARTLGKDYTGQHEYHYGESARPELLAVLRLKDNVDLLIIDAEIAHTPEQIVTTFDHSLAHCWNDGSAIHTLPSFDESVERRIIFTYSRIKTSPEHLLRVRAKYPDYVMVQL